VSPAPTPAFEPPHRTLPVRLFNSVGRLLRRCGWRRPLSAERILARACRRAGLDDFGALDIGEPLCRLVDDLERENRLTPLGRLLIHSDFTRLACARLGVVAALKAHAEVLREEVSRPIFVLGLPRTGSTLLHRLLAQDPAARALFSWEMARPRPAAARRGRVRLFGLYISLLNRCLAPGLRAIHPVEDDAPEECFPLLMNTFRALTFRRYGSIPNYLTWLDGQGLDIRLRVYEQYRRQLQLLQWRFPPRRWVLKCPSHAYSLDALLELFPDACVVQTHRELTEVVPSACSLRATNIAMYTEEADPRLLAAESTENLVHRILRPALAARAAHPGRVHDVAYRSLVSDPVGTVHSIYERFGLSLSAAAEQAMRAWLAANPQGKYGRHRYSLEQFGLDRDAIDRLFPGYPECFGLPAEAALCCAAHRDREEF
jgi:hypothetical protein